MTRGSFREAIALNGNEFLAGRWLKSVLATRGHISPDGRALFQYGLSSNEIGALKETLVEAFHAGLPETPRLLGAAFCLWAAYWFQREFTGGYWAWQGAMGPIGAPNDPISRERLVTEGLSYLRRPIRRINGAREFLPTIVLEGGFPSRLIREGGGWLTRYIEAVTLAASQGQSSLESAFEHATFYQSLIPRTFRAASLFHLAAELSHHVSVLRKRLSGSGISEGAIEWLDEMEPGWRSRLPIATGDEAARRLVEGLVRVRPRVTAMPVACRRLLKRKADGSWSTILRLQVEGRIEDDELPPEVKAALALATRARILPAGLLETTGLPALGVANRLESTDWKGWEVESFMGNRPIDVDDFPISSDARLVFSIGGGPAIEFVPSGGTRVISDVLVFREEDPTMDGNAATLVLTATGSVKDRQKQLFVAAGTLAVVQSVDGGEITEIGLVGDRKLFRISGSVEVSVGGDRYHIRSNAEHTESARIEVVGERLIAATSTYPIYRGAPSFLIFDGVLKRRGDRNSLRMRCAGRKEAWKPFQSETLPLGLVEVSALSGAWILDRVAFVHVPRFAKIALSVPSHATCKVEVTGFSATNIQPLTSTIEAIKITDGFAFCIETVDAQPTNFTLRARWESSEATLTIPALTKKLAFYDSRGRAIPNHALLSTADLRGASAEAVAPSSVLITVLEQRPSGKSLCVERGFERTLPFSQIRDDIERLFAMTDELDAEVKVEAIHAGATSSIIRLRRFDLVLEPDENREVTLSTASMRRLQDDHAEDIWVYGRPFGDMGGADRKLDTYANSTGLHWTVPDGEGPWFVYARADGVTRSRPLHINRKLRGSGPVSSLLDAVLTVNRVERETRILAVLQYIGAAEDINARQELTSFITTIDPALPLQSFDVLRLLPHARRAAVQLAVNCNESILRKVMEIDEKLPFSWFATEPAWWPSAFSALRNEYADKMRGAGLANSSQYADDLARSRIHEIARGHHNMSVHLAVSLKALKIAPNEAAHQGIKDAYAALGSGPAISGFLYERMRDSASKVRTRNDGRQWPTPIDFRLRFAGLPTTKFESPAWANPVIDAPCASAAVALGDLKWSLDIERAIRVCRAFDTAYFDETVLLALTIGWASPARKRILESQG